MIGEKQKELVKKETQKSEKILVIIFSFGFALS